jgi:hypothetical protein
VSFPGNAVAVPAGGSESADFINIRMSVLPAWSVANGIQFAIEALLPYGLIQEEPYENRTDFVS